MGFACALCLLAACSRFQPPADLPPVTRVASLKTPTPSPVLPTPTLTPSAPATAQATDTPRDPPPTPTATLPPIVRLMAVGDVMLARTVGEVILRDGAAAPFSGVASTLNAADLLVGNLECAIAERGEPQPKRYTFRAPPQAAEALALAGFDVVGLANNHSLDYGPEALADTLALLAEQQIAAAGAGQNAAAARTPVVVERNGVRVAFLAYVDVPVESRTGFDTRSWIADEAAPGVVWAEVEHISADVLAARSRADLVIVLLHSGWESHDIIRAQRVEARAAIDAGAALVLGSHPHVLQGVESYHGGLIVYSLGNFVFDGFTFPENYSVIFTAVLTRRGVEAYDWIPIIVENGLPRLAAPGEAPEILSRLQPLP